MRGMSTIQSPAVKQSWTGQVCNGNGTGWVGVTCAAGRVTELNLTGNVLGGVLPPELYLLPTLVVFECSSYSLSVKGLPRCLIRNESDVLSLYQLVSPGLGYLASPLADVGKCHEVYGDGLLKLAKKSHHNHVRGNMCLPVWGFCQVLCPPSGAMLHRLECCA